METATNEYMIRTASNSDISLIGKLFITSKAKFFGEKRHVPMSQLFCDYQTHRLVVYKKNEQDVLLAYAEFCIYPNIPVLSNDCWLQWLKCRFCIDVPVTLMNTMFFNFCIYLSNDEDMLEIIVRELFYREHKIAYLIVARPPKPFHKEQYDELEPLGKIYLPSAFDLKSGRYLPTVIIIARTSFMPVISFRKALPEDNDDVIEMIDVEDPQMRSKHGDYFIAETLLGAQGGTMDMDKIIVTEDSGAAAIGSTGMMWLSEKVDIESLARNFDLESLGNLVTCTPDLPHGSVRLEVFAAEQRQYLNLKPHHLDLASVVVSLPSHTRSNYEDDENHEEILVPIDLYSKFKYITDELHNRSNYLNKVPQTLTIPFDLPAGGRKSSTRESYSLNRASRAFIVKTFILHPSLRLEYSYYYLCAMFSTYTERDYCVVPVPPGSTYSVNLLALLKFFIRVQHRPTCEIADEVFVAHRCSINTELSIYRFAKGDIADVHRLLKNINKSNVSKQAIRTQVKLVREIMADVLINHFSEFSFWIIRCGQMTKELTTPVGFAILRPFSDYSSVYKQFMLPFDDGNRLFERGELVMLRLHPYFHMWSDEVLRTVALRSRYREIFYIQEISAEDQTNDLAQKMMPVEPRRMRRNWFIDAYSESCYRRSSSLVRLSKINCVIDEFYLFRHNLFPTKCFGNSSPIVIVGFSDICKAFLRLMLFGWNTTDYKYVNMNNCLPVVDITVIVNHGEIEAEYDPHVECEYCFNKDQCYLNTVNSCPFVMDTTKRLDMRNWINFVSAQVLRIDRTAKNLVLDNNCKIYYDKLLLLCETKYGPKPDMPVFNHELPYNYAQVNCRLDKIELYHKLVEFNKCKVGTKSIIIYGNNLAVFECIDFLVEHNCDPANITYVQPLRVMEPEYINNPTDDKNLIDILMDIVRDLGLKVIEPANFVHFKFFEGVNYIEGVYLLKMPSRESLFLPCSLFINFDENYMPAAMEKILQDSRIRVENHKILVNESYTTNDPHIFAVGKNVAIMWNVFYQYIHTSEREIAQKLIDILGLGQEAVTDEKNFSKPCLFHALLPMGYEVVKVTIPKRYMINQLPNVYGQFMTTYKSETFFRLRLSPKMIVEEIACVTLRQSVPLFFLEYFCGKHQALLNNVHSRWKQGKIDNFLRFFEEPWTEYIMHDRFDEMQSQNHELLKSLMHHVKVRAMDMETGDANFFAACKALLEDNFLHFLRKYRGEFINQFALPEDWQKEKNMQ